MGFFKWLRGERDNARDVLAIQPVPKRPESGATRSASGGHGSNRPPTEAAPVDVRVQIADLIHRKRKIEAIKVLREETGCGLAIAKNAIERGTWPSLLPAEEP